MTKRIYAADDEKDIRELLGLFLKDAGFEVTLFETGEALLSAFVEQPCDLVILDVMMPGRDGIEICAEIRKQSTVPVIVLTARDSELDYAAGYYSGSDDYLTKPFRPGILVMKIKALLRRAAMDNEPAEKEKALVFADLSLSRARRLLFCRGRDIALTGTEFQLLEQLMLKNGDILSRDEVLAVVWGFDAPVETRVVDETVRRVRGKLKTLGSKTLIKAVWGLGYRLFNQEGTK